MADFSADAPEALNAHLDASPYLGGDLPSDIDAKVFNGFKNKVPDRNAFPHLWAWYVFLSQYTPAARNGWKPAAAKAAKAEAPKKEEAKKEDPAAEEDEDDFDFFGGGDEEAEAAAAKIKEEQAAKKEKPAVICKSYVVFEVKPADDSVDLDELAEKIITGITMDGLLWKTEYKKEPVAYGIFKLIMAASIVDDLVSTDNMIEEMQEVKGMIMPDSDEEDEDEEEGEQAEKPPKEKVEGYSVQSVEILAFNKI